MSSVLALIDEAFDRKAWHGTTLYGSLRGLDVATAATRPAPGRHNIWEIIVHAAYWKYTVRRRLTAARRGSFALSGSNWFPRPETRPRGGWSPSDRRALSADIALLVGEHRALRAVVAELSEQALDERIGTITKGYLVRGIVAHDLYHAGQIQLIKRLVR